MKRWRNEAADVGLASFGGFASVLSGTLTHLRRLCINWESVSHLNFIKHVFYIESKFISFGLGTVKSEVMPQNECIFM